MSDRAEKTRIKRIIKLLLETYPNPVTELVYSNNFQLLVAVILSAQCTDKRVNIVTENLFKRYKNPQDMASLDWEALAEEIKTCGLFRSKSKNIVAASRILMEKYNSQVPQSRAELESLPGVGRKTANVVLNVAFNKQVMPVDTHVFRVSRRAGFSKGTTPRAVEEDLMRIIPLKLTGAIHHCLILHGRQICKARRPQCEECRLSHLCPRFGI
ncbi:MAG: endonuclease III [Peptococcaceae bacterium]|nr:endonuclease III [Peptococcaceae bacterium]